MKNLFILCILFLACISIAHTQTVVPAGIVHGNWSIGGSPYQIIGDIEIPNDSTLSIDAGVRVEFQGHFRLNVQGQILAEGSLSDSIYFTINDTTGFHIPDTSLGGWNGIRFYNTPSENDTSKLSYCKLKYGKAIGPFWPDHNGGAVSVVEFDKLIISNCLFMHNSATGDDSPSGGAIHLTQSDAQIINNRIIYNYAWDGGGIHIYEANPTFLNNTISNNSALAGGGGIWIGGASNPVFTNDLFSNNSAVYNGGGLVCWQLTNNIFNNVYFSDNKSGWGAGVGFIDCIATINDCMFEDNLADGLGGAIGADFTSLTVKNSTFNGDSATAMSGAIHAWFCNLQVSHSDFINNASYTGGAINAEFSNVEIDSSSFNANRASMGGAIRAYNSNFSLDSCKLANNSSLIDGGALDYGADSLIFDSRYTVDIKNTRFLNNSALVAGGAFSIQQYRMDSGLINFTFNNSEVSGNMAHHVGGFRLLRCMGDAIVSNSTISNNSAEAWIGGATFNNVTKGEIFNCVFFNNHGALISENATTGGLGVANLSEVDVTNCTFVNNSAGVGGGLQLYRGGDAFLLNNIFWGNMPDQIALNAILDSVECILTMNYNDIENGFDSIKINDTVSSIVWGEANMHYNPFFKNQNEGDLHLLEYSYAIGAGIDAIEIDGKLYTCPFFDIKGNSRPEPDWSYPDLGAYEHPNAFPDGIDESQWNSHNKLKMRIYPNPFATSTTFEFQISTTSIVEIKLYNILGKEVHNLPGSTYKPGIHQITWTPKKIENGIYLCRIRVITKENKIIESTQQIVHSK